MKSIARTALSLSFLALASACAGNVAVEYQINPLNRSIQLRVGQELRSATIETFSVSIDTANLQNVGEVIGALIEQRAATADNNNSTALFAGGSATPEVVDRLVVAFGDATLEVAQEANNEELTGFAFALEGTVDVDPNIPGEETNLFVRIKAPATLFDLTFDTTDLKKIETQLLIDTLFDLEAFLDVADYAPLVGGNAIIIDDEVNPEAAQEIQDNLGAALVETRLF